MQGEDSVSTSNCLFSPIIFWPFDKADPSEDTLLASTWLSPDLPFLRYCCKQICCLEITTNFNQFYTQFYQGVLNRSNLHLTQWWLNINNRKCKLLDQQFFFFKCRGYLHSVPMYIDNFQHFGSWLPDQRETKSIIPLYCNNTETSVVYQNSRKVPIWLDIDIKEHEVFRWN